MPNENEWLFDIIWELSDKAYDAGLPRLAQKLESAMDVYLVEHQLQPETKNRIYRSVASVGQSKQSVGRSKSGATPVAQRIAKKVPGLARLKNAAPLRIEAHPRANRVVAR